MIRKREFKREREREFKRETKGQTGRTSEEDLSTDAFEIGERGSKGGMLKGNVQRMDQRVFYIRTEKVGKTVKGGDKSWIDGSWIENHLVEFFKKDLAHNLELCVVFLEILQR